MNIKQFFAAAILIPIVGFIAYAYTSPKPYEEIEKVSISADMPASKHIDSIVLGAGCFWGAEKRYEAIDGVIDAVSGYADGSGVAATYREITKYKNKFNNNNHAEVVKVTFNKSVVNLETILQNYFEGHDPTQLNRQGNDVGTQYRSTVLTNSDEQSAVTNKVREQYQMQLSKSGLGNIVTKVAPLKKFFPAEKYHQDYLAKNPNGYCPDHSTGVKFDADKTATTMVSNNALTKGKHIVIIEAEGYCPYCEKLKENVLNEYKGTIPVSFRLASQLQDLNIKSPTWATPTVCSFIKSNIVSFGIS